MLCSTRRIVHTSTLGVWENLVSGKRKTEKASNNKHLKTQVIQLFKTSKLLDSSKIFWDELQVTALYTDPKKDQK